ncbi:MAG: ABC transporter ATP-binding protein [Candidatus Merdivicinus sp.]|jgi:ATP-binding cassette subfamily B multidrug efflux pump
MKKFWKYVKPYLVGFIIGPLLMIVEVVGEVVLPKLMSMIINQGITTGDTGYIIRIGLLMAGVALIMILGGTGGCYLAAKSSISFATDLRADLFAKVQEFSFQNIDHYSTGSLVTRLTNDVTQVQNVLRMILVMMLRAPGMLVGALIMAFAMNAKLALVIAVIAPILVILLGLIIRTGYPRFEILQKKLDNLNNSIQENLVNVRLIKSFVREDYQNKKFRDTNRDYKEGMLRAMNIVILNMPLMTLMMNITTIAVVWFGGNFVIEGGMQVGDLTAFTTYVVQILMSLMMLSMILLQSSRAIASAHRILEVLNTKVNLTDENASQKDAQVTKGKIEFDHVSFGYGENSVLEDISFTVEPGQTVGIIGATGSGKTSLVQLIPRLYDVSKGRVLVDGIDVRDYSIPALRQGVGMVLQSNVLFSGSILENLRWGDENASMEEVRTVAEHAQADGFIMNFTNGYRTELGQGGVNVSGGQKQRLCIARALLKKPKILILDDSTSAVDTATEARIRHTFRTDLRDTTKLLIAQRITSVMDADQILVMDDGRIVDMGTHAELMERCETYQEIYYSQKEKEEAAV